MVKIKYWDNIDYLQQEHDNLLKKLSESEIPRHLEMYDSLIKSNTKQVIDLHNHSCINWKFPKITVGEKYYLDINIGPKRQYVEIVVTYERSGIVFYKILDKINGIVDDSEYNFGKGSVKHYFMEPAVFNCKLNPEVFEIKSISCRMKINYNYGQ